MSGFDPGSAVPLQASFFERPAAMVARELLGCILVSRIGGVLTAGMIVEAEAYLGADDAGSHAATKGITPRNRVMYGPPAHAYVYFTYGNHHMLNLVAEPDGVAGGVLIRAIEPVVGIPAMSERRHGRSGAELTNGPGKVASALGVDLTHNGTPLGEQLTVCAGTPLPDTLVATSGRIGLSAGHELPLRFYVRDNAYVSRARPGPRPPKGATRTHERKTT